MYVKIWAATSCYLATILPSCELASVIDGSRYQARLRLDQRSDFESGGCRPPFLRLSRITANSKSLISCQKNAYPTGAKYCALFLCGLQSAAAMWMDLKEKTKCRRYSDYRAWHEMKSSAFFIPISHPALPQGPRNTASNCSWKVARLSSRPSKRLDN